MIVLIPTTDGGDYPLKNIVKIRAHGTSTNSDPPPADVNLTDLEPFNWLMTSSGYSVRWPHGTRARILRADGKLEGYV